MDLFSSIGERLREERERLSFSQTDFSAIAADAGVVGATRQSQSLYEKGKRMPDASYLAVIASAGVDIGYVLTGLRQGQGIGTSAVHQAVLDAVDLLSLGKKVDANQLAKAVVKLVEKSATVPVAAEIVARQVFNSQVGTATTVEGDLKQKGFSFFGQEKKK